MVVSLIKKDGCLCFAWKCIPIVVWMILQEILIFFIYMWVGVVVLIQIFSLLCYWDGVWLCYIFIEILVYCRCVSKRDDISFFVHRFSWQAWWVLFEFGWWLNAGLNVNWNILNSKHCVLFMDTTKNRDPRS